MTEQEETNNLKVDIYLLGDQNVGKSTILSNFFQYKLNKEVEKNPIEVYRCQLPFSSSLIVSLTFFDFNGTIELKKEFEKNENSIFLIFFDLTSQESFKNLKNYKKFIPKNSLIFVIGNKMDLFLDDKNSEKRLLDLHSNLKSLKKSLEYFDYYLMTKNDITVKRMFNEVIKIKILNKTEEINFSETKIESDILVKINNEIEMPLHKSILSISPKFCDLFQGKNEINLEINEIDNFISFIDFLYLGKADNKLINELLDDFKINFSNERNEEFFNHFKKNKENYEIIKFLKDHFSIKEIEKNPHIDSLVLSNFSNEELSKLSSKQLFDIYKLLPSKKQKIKDNILIWISSKVGPFDVEDLIEECSKIELESRLLLDRCKLWMKALQITAGIAMKIKDQSSKEESKVLSVSKEQLEELAEQLKENEEQ
eukprot:gene4198-7508_t